MYVVPSLAMFVTFVNFYLLIVLMVSEPDVTLMRFPFYNIRIYVRVSNAKPVLLMDL